jgi:hypothetical protein
MGTPVASTAISKRSPSRSPRPLATRAAPSLRATSSRSPTRSTTVTGPAPACTSSCSSSRPIVPAPVSRTSSPKTGPSRRRPWTAQASGSTIAPNCPSIPSGSRCALTAGTATYSANAPATVSPMAAQFSHRLSRPDRQRRQCPQYSEGSTATRAPTGRSIETSRPRAATVPANSCPGVIGYGVGGNSPSMMCRSVPQTPQHSTFTTIWPGPGAGSGSSATRKLPGRSSTMALMRPP